MSDRDLMTAVVRGWHEQHLRAKARGVQRRAATPAPLPSHAQSGRWQGAEHLHGQHDHTRIILMEDSELGVYARNKT